LVIARGGTNATSFTSNKFLIFNGTSIIASVYDWNSFSVSGHTHIKSNITDFVESSYVHANGDEVINGNKTFNGNVIIEGNLTTINSIDLSVNDNEITLNSGETGSGISEGYSGLVVDRGLLDNAILRFDETDDKWKIGVGSSLVEISILGHIHDDRYFTETEITTNYYTKVDIDDNIYTKLESDTLFASIIHNHDDRYYTEIEISDLLALKSNIDHIHDDRYYTKNNMQASGQSQLHWDNITNKPDLSGASHNHDDRYYSKTEIDSGWYTINQLNLGSLDNRYFTETEITTNYYSKTQMQTPGSAQLHWDNIINKPSTYTPSVHNHDDRYYTETEITTNYYSKTQMQTPGSSQLHWDNIINKPSTYTPSVHNHDDRYYTEVEVNNLLLNKSDITHIHDDIYFTETEVNNLLLNKSDITHIHDDRYYTETEMQTSGSSQLHWDNITNRPTVFNPASHTHDDRYFTETEITTNYYTKAQMQTSGLSQLHWDNIINKPATYVPTSHNHDDRYFTETESDTRYALLSHTHIKSNITDFIESSYVHTSGDETINGNKTFNGNITFTGTTTVVNSQTLNIADNIITLNSDYTGSTPSENAGLEIKRGSLINASIIWDESLDKWKAGLLGSETEISLFGHMHDDRYYTEGESDNRFAQIIHNHDDMYYTEIELDNGQLNNIYYTENEIDTKFANFKTAGVKEVVDQYEDLLEHIDEVPGTVYIVRERSGIITGQPQLYQQTANTIIHMKFDGNTNDVMGHVNTGSSNITYEAGKVSQAGVFNNSYRTYANTPDLNVTGTFSCGVWFYPTQLDPTKNYSLFDKYPTNGSQSGWGLIIEEGGRIQIWAMGPNQPFIRVRTYSKLRLNQWTHIGLSFDGTIIKLWKNAVVVAELPFNGDIGANTAPIDIGRYYSDYLYGKLDDLFYTRDTLSYNDFMRIVNNGPFADYRDEGFWKWDGTQWIFLIQNMSGIYHNELLGVNREEFMHLTKNEYSGLTKGLDTSLHLHDNRYYTETEMQTSGSSQLHWDNITNKPDLGGTSHNHDDRYYTEVEVNNLLLNKSDITHIHDDRYFTETEITTNYYSKNQLNTGQLDTRYYTETEINSLLAGKAALVHNHDDLYYPKTYIDQLSGLYSLSSHTHDDRYYLESEVNALLNAKANVSHDHNSLYFTKTELGSSSGVSGASRVGVSMIGGITATNVQSALQELKSQISSASVSLNQAYTTGSVITTTNTQGPVKIDATGSTRAPLELTNLITAPTSNLSGGQIAVIDGELYIYNINKNKWLTPTKTLLFGRSGSVDGHSLYTVGQVGTFNSGYKMIKNGTIVSAAIEASNSPSKNIYILINGITTYTITSTPVMDTDINLDFSVGDFISMYVDSAGSSITNVVATLEIAWRK